jgi:Protein of unknown function (DUF1479)
MHLPDEQWPQWPEFTNETAELDAINVQIKKDIAAQYGEEALRKSWLKVCDKLNALTPQIEEKQGNIISELSYEEFFQLSDAEKEELKNRGCFIVRGTVSKQTATTWFEGLQKYVADNDCAITGTVYSGPPTLWQEAF